jgi:hypothetical protein
MIVFQEVVQPAVINFFTCGRNKTESEETKAAG